MKSSLILLSFTMIIIFSGCKSEEQKNEPKQIQRNQNVLPPKTEQPQQTIQKQENIDPKVATEIIAVIKENIAATAGERQRAGSKNDS